MFFPTGTPMSEDPESRVPRDAAGRHALAVEAGARSAARPDSSWVAPSGWPRFSRRGYGLATLAAEFGIEFQHHDPARTPMRPAWCCCAPSPTPACRSMIGPTAGNWIMWCECIRGSTVTARPPGGFLGRWSCLPGRYISSREEAADLAAAAGCDVAASISSSPSVQY
jgi:hypothetical protein